MACSSDCEISNLSLCRGISSDPVNVVLNVDPTTGDVVARGYDDHGEHIFNFHTEVNEFTDADDPNKKYQVAYASVSGNILSDLMPDVRRGTWSMVFEPHTGSTTPLAGGNFKLSDPLGTLA